MTDHAVLKLWVDDERNAPDDSWTTAKTSDKAIEILYMAGTPACNDVFAEISLDHDLGDEDTGMKVLDWMIGHDYWPKTLTIHTMNPPARKRMLQAATTEGPLSMDIYWISQHVSKGEDA